MGHLGVELPFRLKFEDNALRSEDLSYIPAARRPYRPPISNRDTERLETAVSQRKQTTGTGSNRDKTRHFSDAIWIPGESHRQLPDAKGHRILTANEIIRIGGNPQKTKDATHP